MGLQKAVQMVLRKGFERVAVWVALLDDLKGFQRVLL